VGVEPSQDLDLGVVAAALQKGLERAELDVGRRRVERLEEHFDRGVVLGRRQRFQGQGNAYQVWAGLFRARHTSLIARAID
jgi:hypothetical protein